MPNLNYTYFGPTSNGNCAPQITGQAGPGVPGPNLPGLASGGGTIPYTWTELVGAANMAGAFPWGAGGLSAAIEMNWRASTLRVAACTVGGYLEATPLLPYLERQERISLTNALGMTLAIYTARRAGFSFPMHFSRYTSRFSYVPNPAFTANTPDLVFAQSETGTCQIWEAKGSAGTFATGVPLTSVSGILDRAMNQARKVDRLEGPWTGQVIPNARVASLARLDPATNQWHVHVADPPDGGPAPDRREDDYVQKLAFYREFYAPYVEVVADSGETVTSGGITYAVARIPGTSVWTGLDERIKNLFTVRKRLSPEQIVEKIEDYVQQGYPQDDDPARFVSAEGIFTYAVEEEM